MIPHPKGWNNPHATRSVQIRNEKYRQISNYGYNCVPIKLDTLKQIDLLHYTIQKYGEDGKTGLRIHLPPKTKLKMKSITQNMVFISLGPDHYCKNSDELPDNYKTQKQLLWKNKNKLLAEIRKAKERMKEIQTTIDTKRQRRYTLSSVTLIVGSYYYTNCKVCRRPHYEHIVTDNSFHVCPFCGYVYQQSNINIEPQRFLNCEGKVNKYALTAAAPDQTTVPIEPERLNNRERACRRIKTMIGSLCDQLNCDSGDFEHYIRKHACKIFEYYTLWLKNINKLDEDFNTKLKMGKWQLACVFVWYAILHMEQRTKTHSIWPLSVICKTGGELHDSDGYIPNYEKKGLKRKSRPVRFETVHRYAEQIKNEWGMEGLPYLPRLIPSINSIDCVRGKDITKAINKYIECHGKKSQKFHLPTSNSWDMFLVGDKNTIKINPDIDGIAFQNGLRLNDILTEVNGIKIDPDVNNTYKLIMAQKSKRRKGVQNVVTLTILR